MHCVSARLSAVELGQLDAERGAYARGEYLRMAALGSLPPSVPAINERAWLDLAKVAGNLNQLAWYANETGGVVIVELTDMLRDLRARLLGLEQGTEDE